MSVSGKLLVERGSYDAPSQDWGDFAFLSVPSPGDRVAVSHEGETHYLTVLCAHHRPIAQRKDGDPKEFGFASVEIVTKWTGKEK